MRRRFTFPHLTCIPFTGGRFCYRLSERQAFRNQRFFSAAPAEARVSQSMADYRRRGEARREEECWFYHLTGVHNLKLR